MNLMEKNFIQTLPSSDSGLFENNSNIYPLSHMPVVKPAALNKLNNITNQPENQSFFQDNFKFSRLSTMNRWWVETFFDRLIMLIQCSGINYDRFFILLCCFSKLISVFYRQSDNENLNFDSNFSNQQIFSMDNHFTSDFSYV